MMGVKVEVEIGASWFPVDIRFPTIQVSAAMSLVFVWKEMEPTVVQELKKTTATKKHLGLNPQISVCETGTLTGSFTQVCSGRMKAFYFQ